MSSIFLCHSSLDKPFVRLLKTRLEAFEVRVWLDEDEISPGISLMTAISAAIDDMEFLGVVLSPNSVRSHWVREELEIALSNQIADAKIKVIPLLYRPCELPSFLRGKKYVDFTRWSRNRRSDKSHETLDALVKQVVKAIGVDPNNAERWSGKKMITVKDFRRRMVEHFAPRPVHVRFFEDESGLEYIKVDNDDSTFELYQYWSHPSYLDVVNDVFRRAGEPPIVDVTLPPAFVWSAADRDGALNQICAEHGVARADFLNHYDTRGNQGIWRAPGEKYTEWLFEQSLISLIRQGDFGSTRKP